MFQTQSKITLCIKNGGMEHVPKKKNSIKPDREVNKMLEFKRQVFL
jgi:hypothetical protein